MTLRTTAILIIFFAISFAASTFTPFLSAASEAEKKQAELEQLRERIQSVRTQLYGDIGKRDEVTQQLRATEREAGKIAAELRELDIDIDYKQLNLESLRREQGQTETELAKHSGVLARQVRSAYATGRQERIKLLLNQEDPAVFGRVVTYYDYLNRARAVRIETVKNHLTRLAELEALIDKELTELADLRNQRQSTLIRLERSRDERAGVLASLEASIRNRNIELERLRADEQSLAELIGTLQEVFADIPAQLDDLSAFSDLRGSLPWPSDGRIVNNFGEPRVQEGQLRWQGVMIAAEPGSAVRAISRGRVAYADWLPHYGLLMVIEHGDGYMSLYGHNQSLYKELGDWVEAGEVIASIGDSGGQTRTALYFEIRHGRVPLDPRRWCARPAQG
ncbi:MAG: peptidoglycan DD-metalloendopeptidase family protein [Gammaproteobacteria bacterium]|nr:peptidoglycan DD-metalloendopeptidase family protein [Gammaproteobacteria bacterium]